MTIENSATLTETIEPIGNPSGMTGRVRMEEMRAAYAAAEKEVGPSDGTIAAPRNRNGAMDTEAHPVTSVTDPGTEAADDTGKETEKVIEKPKPAKVEKKTEKKDGEEHVTLKNFIEERRQLRDQSERKEALAQQRESQRHQAFQQRSTELAQREARIAPLERALQAVDDGDADAFAKLLGEARGDTELTDWNKLNDRILQNMQSPVYKETIKLKSQLAARDKAEAEQRRAYQEQQTRQQHEAQLHQYKEQLANELAEDTDEALPALVKLRPQLIEQIYQVQQAHYDRTGGEVLHPRMATEKVLKDVYGQLQSWAEYFESNKDSDLVRQIMGDRGAIPEKNGSQSATRKGKTEQNGNRDAASLAKPGAKVPTNISHSRTAEASAAGHLSPKELMKRAAKDMEESFANTGRWVG